MNESTIGASGLTQAEAAARLEREGFNELPRGRGRDFFHIVLSVLSEPMFALLVGAGLVYLLLGDLVEAVVLLIFATLSTSIAVVQELRSEHVLEALRDLTSPRALVVRDGAAVRIPGREVVRGDLVMLNEGDRVPADAKLIEAHDMLADESLLTGESVPVAKRRAASDEAVPVQVEDPSLVFSGTLVVRGHAKGVVTATGIRSEIGRIGKNLQAIESEPPRLQAQTRRIVRVFGGIAAVVCVAAVLLQGFVRGGWLDALLGGIALGMSMLPEEFPLVLTVFMVMGAWRISQARVLTRRAAAIETLGATTVLCTDKTGTLTENKMTVAEVRSRAQRWRPVDSDIPQHVADLLHGALLASVSGTIDPMERAVSSAATVLPGGEDAIRGDKKLVKTYGLRPELLAVTHVWEDGPEMGVFAKGAPEAIAELCRLDESARVWLRSSLDDMALGGMRVLGVARAKDARQPLPETPHGFDFEFLGLVGFADPVRANVPAAVAECRSAGIRVVMLTGDYPQTARAIARQAGIDVGDVLTGSDVTSLSDQDLAERLRTTNVFARIKPEQKLRIVQALKADGEVVAMTGDGVNDAPALKAAHIGVAMGGRGTDVAREASSIVLLDDDFASLVRTVRLGRRIYDNLRKAMSYIIAVHVPIAGLALLPLLLGIPAMLLPVHIAFLEMVIDPACSIVFESEMSERDVMRRPPRHPDSPLLSAPLIRWGVVQGLLLLIAVAATLGVAMLWNMPGEEMRALVFSALVLTNLGAILVNRSYSTSLISIMKHRNTSFWWLLGGILTLLSIVNFWLPARALFHFGPLHIHDFTVAAIAGLGVLFAITALKPIWRAAYER